MCAIENDDSYFIHFKENIETIALPERFTFPFYYEPHPLCKIAAKELQQHLETSTQWQHDFGIQQHIEGTNIGKMFGVLIVQNEQNEIGYLAAFSGKIADRNNYDKFVPPIVDILQEDGFFRIGEEYLNKINKRISTLEKAPEYFNCKTRLITETQKTQQQLQEYRARMKQAKKQRDLQRQNAATELSSDKLDALKEQLKKESLKWQFDEKQIIQSHKNILAQLNSHVAVFENEINSLKEERKAKSAALQQQIFDLYQFLNIKGQTKGVCEIFSATDQKTPPSGAGDCAGPKLLQYAFLHNLKPLAMAEFWWGQSPKSEIKKHGNFYPSCRGKCEPILGHMLAGIEMDDNPMLIPTDKGLTIDIIYEDEALLVVNKPAEFLSVPGKTNTDSVYERIKHKYPHATGPLIVHRLDMSTSGIMVLAKTKDVHKHLQNQFLNRTVKKYYIALLDGIVKENSGTIDLPLRVDLDDRPRQLVCYQYGKPARTQWQVIERKNGQTRIQFYPITGRTHQLRVHTAHSLGLNCPIVGDDLYGKKANRLHLHAEYLEFRHPITKEQIHFTSKPDF